MVCQVRPESSERCSVPSELRVQRGMMFSGRNASLAAGMPLFIAKVPAIASAVVALCDSVRASLALPGTMSANEEAVLASAISIGAAFAGA